MPSVDSPAYISFHSFEPAYTRDCAKFFQQSNLQPSTAIRNCSLTVVEQACYPTPPASPDLDEPVLALAPSPPRAGNIFTVQLDDIADSDNEDADHESELDIDEGDAPVLQTATRVHIGPIPIPIILDTPHHLPQIASFRLRSPSSLLALNGGSRSLHFDFDQTIIDSMPYSAAAAAIHGRRYTDEDAVESIISGDGTDQRPNSLHWSLRQNDHIGAIFVQPPTPERSEVTSSMSSTSSQPSPAPQKTTVKVQTVPVAQVPSPPSSSLRTMPVPLQVLPEVRSPPRRTVAMAPDVPVLPQKRGRRPRLFGFTELPDSGSSASSSAANSRNPSPERSGSPSLPSPSAPPGPASNFIPRRQPIRARSETHLPTIATIASSSKLSAPSPTQPLQPPRRRENGLKLDFTGIVPVTSPAEAQSSVIPSPYSAKLIRKKSGEILKPALKYGGPLAANGTPLEGPRTDLTPDSPASARFESKSCPTTPSCPKYVHFDAQLERVKLFLQDQKPQVVSRAGSPSEHWTTSEGEEYPFPSTDDEREAEKILQIKLPNFPTYHAPDTDLYLESLFLDDDRKNLRGMILCKNLAYHKWVAVRFTFDFWQTTSEVTATHKDVVKGGKYDRFSFIIKLGDILPRIEEKTMFLAIRYNTDGKEIWDSNAGQNYQVLFEKVRRFDPIAVPKRSSVSIQPGMGKAVGGRTSQWSVTGGNADDRLADLRAKLSRLTADDMATSPPERSPNRTSFGLSPSRRNSGRQAAESPSASPQRGHMSLASDLPVAGGGLAARYDFGAALKTTRKTSPSPKHSELPEVQTGLLNYNKAHNGHAAMEFYSPRFNSTKLPETTTDSFFTSNSQMSDSSATMSTSKAPSNLDIPDLQVQGPSPPATDDSKVQPIGVSSPQRPGLSRAASLPVINNSPRESPPSLDASGNVTDSPYDSPKSPPDVVLPKWSPVSTSEKKDEMSLASYSSFIEQFCWGGVAAAPSPPRRAHSSSSLDMYFNNGGYAPGTRSPSNGEVTPRPFSYPSGTESNGGNQSPVGSFYSSFSGPINRDSDDSSKGEGLHLELERSRSSPRFAAMKMGVDRMSPPVTCSM